MHTRARNMLALGCLSVAMLSFSPSSAEAGHWRHGHGWGHHHGWHDGRDDDWDDGPRWSFNYTQWNAPDPYARRTYAPYVPDPNFQPLYQPANTQQNRYCREYTRDAMVGGRRQQTYGTACLQPDGDWEIVD